MKSLVFLVLMLCCFSGSHDIVSAVEVQELDDTGQVGYIFIGDSRTVGLNNICSVDSEDNIWVVAKVGKGYNWLKSDAESQIYDIVESNTDISDWVLISNFGVNDLCNIRKYEDWYSGVLDDFNVVVVSVNPVDDGYSYMSGDILSFNRKMRDFCKENEIGYIDTYNNVSFSTVDGLHYNASTYRRIKDYIFEEVMILCED